MSKFHGLMGRSKRYGTCEYCNTYSIVLNMITIIRKGSLVWTKKDKSFYSQPFWCCNTCINRITRLGATYVSVKNMIEEESIEKSLLKTGHIHNTLIRKMKTLEEIFPDEIDGIFIIPPGNLPVRFQKRTNIMVSFKNLSILQYSRHVIDKDECLMHTWDCLGNTGASHFASKAKFWGTKITRILMALARVHFQSELISIWVWGDTRIHSIEFFCKNPAYMVQASPNKILRVI